MTVTKEKYREFLESQLTFLDGMIPSQNEILERMNMMLKVMNELYWLDNTIGTVEINSQVEEVNAPLGGYTDKELCDEILHRVSLFGTEIMGDLMDWLQCKLNMELLESKENSE